MLVFFMLETFSLVLCCFVFCVFYELRDYKTMMLSSACHKHDKEKS